VNVSPDQIKETDPIEVALALDGIAIGSVS